MMTELTLIRTELKKWEAELIGSKERNSSDYKLLEYVDTELGAVRTFIKMIDKHQERLKAQRLS